jgi:hypothetical protein
MSITTEEKLNDRLKRAVHHREQLDAITADMCLILAIEPGTVACRLMRSAAYGDITLNEALTQLVNDRLAELAAIQIEGVE